MELLVCDMNKAFGSVGAEQLKPRDVAFDFSSRLVVNCDSNYNSRAISQKMSEQNKQF